MLAYLGSKQTLDSQSLPTFGAARIQNFAARFGCHTSTKTVSSLSL